MKEINGTTLRTLPVKLTDILRQKDIPAVANIAASHVDECLAGMLSKGILTRLARRHVVKDWGGFAPYFVRHAKKFTAVREKLETADLSVESVVGKLAYNMIDDENAQQRSEEDIALEQWLRQIPEDPAGLLRRKFMLEHMQRRQQ